jgi:glutamine amidotransferase
MITVVDCGLGNVGSILNMLDHLGVDSRASNNPSEIAEAQKLILPGVGSFDRAMKALAKQNLIEPLDEAVLHHRKPILGVCLGMQLFANHSEEGHRKGLGYLNAEVKRITIPKDSPLKIPHVGWSNISVVASSRLFISDLLPWQFYFTHSFHMMVSEPEVVTARVSYGENLCCAVEKNNIYGVQFHPEKSHRYGMNLLRAFASLGSHPEEIMS